MYLIDEAVINEVFGIKMYAFGLYVALGALCSLAVVCLVRRCWRLKQGTSPVLFLLSVLCGTVISRLAFCLMNQDLNMFEYVRVWPQVTGGGWSMFGLLAGIFLGGRLCARMTKQSTGRIWDVLSLAVFPMMIAERIGESRIEEFDLSRSLDSDLLANTFLAMRGDELRLRTYYVAAAVYLALFIVMMILAVHSGRDGDLSIRFLLLFGAASIILESLRYDFFLSISFVGLQQVAAALTLALGVILAVKRCKGSKPALAIAAVVSLPLMVGAVVGLEFALDRTTWNKILIYALMILTVAVPAGLGLRLLHCHGKGSCAA